MLRNCLPQNVRRVLSELPKSLDETYERVLKEIGKVNPYQAYRLLQCLTVAIRPLRVEELAEFLALDFDEAKEGIPVLNKHWRSDDQQHGVLSTCSSLITIVDDRISRTRFVQFAHFSVKEFLTSDRLANLKADISYFHIHLEPAHTIVTRACLGILLQSDDNTFHNDEVKSSSPLTGYAARYWIAHAQFEKVSSRVKDGMRRLFDAAKPYFAAWLKLYDIDEEWTSFTRTHSDFPIPFNWSAKPTPSREDYAPLCLYYASLCGFCDLTKHLIASNPEHVNADVGLNKSPLVAALRNRHIQVAELLHRHGANLHVMGSQSRTILHAASKDGFMDVAQWLLKAGADASARQDDHTTPLHLAAVNGHLELVRILLEHGVDDVNAFTRYKLTPLHEASEGGHINIVRLLIQHGADVHVQSMSHSTPLHLASSFGNTETVQLLIQHEADVNSQDQRHSTPLHLASFAENAKTVQLLVKHGANVNARDRDYKTPLHVASSKWVPETVQLLIENGADVNAWDGIQNSPLHVALSWGDIKSVQLLVEHGADVNTYNGNRLTPLHLASFNGRPEAVGLLIVHGADINARDWYHSTALHLAAFRSGVESARLLIEHGADVLAQDIVHWMPLHVSSYFVQIDEWLSNDNVADQESFLHWRRQDMEVIRLLLEHRADVNAYNGSHSTPLHQVVSDKNIPNAVRLLLEHGANVDMKDGNGLTAFQIASSRGFHDIVQLLDPDKKNKEQDQSVVSK